MPDALAVVNVGNRACEFLKLTPRSRTIAMVGAVSGVTFRPRSPSGMNRMMLCVRVALVSWAATGEMNSAQASANASPRISIGGLPSWRRDRGRFPLGRAHDGNITAGQLPGCMLTKDLPESVGSGHE